MERADRHLGNAGWGAMRAPTRDAPTRATCRANGYCELGFRGAGRCDANCVTDVAFCDSGRARLRGLPERTGEDEKIGEFDTAVSVPVVARFKPALPRLNRNFAAILTKLPESTPPPRTPGKMGAPHSRRTLRSHTGYGPAMSRRCSSPIRAPGRDREIALLDRVGHGEISIGRE